MVQWGRLLCWVLWLRSYLRNNICRDWRNVNYLSDWNPFWKVGARCTQAFLHQVSFPGYSHLRELEPGHLQFLSNSNYSMLLWFFLCDGKWQKGLQPGSGHMAEVLHGWGPTRLMLWMWKPSAFPGWAQSRRWVAVEEEGAGTGSAMLAHESMGI